MKAEHIYDGVAPVAADGHGLDTGHPDGAKALRAQVANLERALVSQRQIGMVIGLLAHRFGCTSEQAWLILVRLSQDTNIKVRVVARVLVEAFDGTTTQEDAPLLTVLRAQLPAAGWPGLRRDGESAVTGGGER